MKFRLLGTPKRSADIPDSSSSKLSKNSTKPEFKALNGAIGKSHIEEPVTDWEALTITVPSAIALYLACHEEASNREVVAELFFNTLVASRVRANLRSNLNKVRKDDKYSWASAYLSSDDKQVTFNAECDVREFKKAFDEKRYQDVVALYQGEFLEGFDGLPTSFGFNDWVIKQRSDFKNKYYIATRELTRNLVTENRASEAIDLLAGFVQKDVFSEEATELCEQMLSIALGSSQLVKGLDCYRDYKTALKAEAEKLELDEVEAAEELELLAQKLKDLNAANLNAISQTISKTRGLGINVARPITPVAESSIPPQATKFIGRDNEINELLGQFLDFNTRMVSLIGYGGVGKTRLAVQLATSLQDYYVDGVFVVELVAIQSIDNIPSTINSVLGIKAELGENPEDALNRVLKDKQLLLVLDNFEHLLEGRDLIDSLLGKHKNLDIIATSREALNLSWEYVYDIQGLNYPRIKNPNLVYPEDLVEGQEVPKNILENEALPENVEVIADFEDYDAVKLFLRTAKARVTDFSLSRNKAAIQQICSFVEGLPLGIELSASWVSSLSCEKIAEMLQNDTAIKTRLKDVPDRHKSLDVVFEHSWSLLDEQERDVLAKTAIFQGGFDNAAAEAIIGTSLEDLATLCEKSLLRLDDNGRYGLHEVIRQNAVGKLVNIPEMHKAVVAAHQKFYMSLIDKHDNFILNENLENIEAAWFSSIETYGPDSEVLRMGRVFNKIYISQAMTKRALWLVETSLIKLQTAQEDHKVKLLEADLLRGKAHCLDNLGFPKEALRYEEEVYELAKELNDPILLINANHRLAISYERLGNLVEATNLLEVALNMAEEHDLYSSKGLLLDMLARVQNKIGDVASAETNYKKAIALSEVLEDNERKVLRLNNYCTLLFSINRYQEAKELILETLKFSRENNIKRSRHLLLKKLAQIYLVEKDFELAWNTAAQAQTACNEQGAKKVAPQIINVFADISLAIGNISKAKEGYLEALKLAIPIASYDAKYAALIGLAKIHMLNNEQIVAVSLLNSLMQQENLRPSLKSVTTDVLEELKNVLSEASYFKSFQEGNTDFLEQYCLQLFT